MLVEADGVGILDVGGAEEGFGKGDAEECGCSVGGGLKGEQGGEVLLEDEREGDGLADGEGGAVVAIASFRQK